MIGIIRTTITTADTVIAREKPKWPIAAIISGVPDDAAKARAVQRQADRHAALPVEPQAERVGDDAEAGSRPAEREHGVGEIELPGLLHLADRDGGG